MFVQTSSMKLIKYMPLCLLALMAACNNQRQEKPHIKAGKAVHAKDKSISEILKEAMHEDPLEYNVWDPFTYVKTGRLLNSGDKTALVIQRPDDLHLQVELFTLLGNTWKLNDKILLPEKHLIQFHVFVQDYNFDGCNDFYIQATNSNSYAMSRGNLITVNPENYKLIYHAEVRSFANMAPDTQTKTVFTDSLTECLPMKPVVCKIPNKWIHDKLVPQKVKCHCP